MGLLLLLLAVLLFFNEKLNDKGGGLVATPTSRGAALFVWVGSSVVSNLVFATVVKGRGDPNAGVVVVVSDALS